MLSEAGQKLMSAHKDLDIRLEPSADLVTARKLTELNGRADLIVTADAWTIESMLMPQHAAFSLLFATQEIVLAYKDHSRYTEEVSADNWSNVLLRPEVILGRADPDLDPIGKQTLWVWKLADQPSSVKPQTALSQSLTQKVRREHVARDGEELLSLLETRAVDYVFVPRNLAEDHNLKLIQLPPAINLSDPVFARRYAEVSIPVRAKGQAVAQSRFGAPAYVALTIPKSAPHPRDAALLVAYLTSREGRKLLLRHGLRPLSPPHCQGCESLPDEIKSLETVPENP